VLKRRAIAQHEELVNVWRYDLWRTKIQSFWAEIVDCDHQNIAPLSCHEHSAAHHAAEPTCHLFNGLKARVSTI
jgi:hypothetical protein